VGRDAADSLLSSMPRGLHLYYGAHEPHFITCSCYHRRPNLRSTPARNRFLSILEQTRKRYRFVVIGYVIMPEHIHLLLSEPEVGTISTVMQVLKQRTARALLPKVKPDPLCATHPSQKAREGRATRPGGPTAVYVAGTTGPLYYRHADWLGSSRLASTQSRTKYFDVSYAPFGEDYNDLGTTDYNFTGQNQDTETGYYDFLFREYSPVQGRWLSPDPAGTAAADPTNPQSWNRYVYVLNNPLALVDPLGLDCVYLTDDGGHVQEIDHEAINDGECAASGGYWIEGSVNDPSWVTIDSDAGTVSGYGVTVDGFLELSVAGAMAQIPLAHGLKPSVWIRRS
jgi:RHS repeat-associated protein